MTSDPRIVLVPFAPTEAMLNAARDWSVKVNGRGVGNDQATGCYQAMVAAADRVAPAGAPEAAIKPLLHYADGYDRLHADIAADFRRAARFIAAQAAEIARLREALTEYVRDFGDNEDDDSQRMAAKARAALAQEKPE